MGMGPSTLSMRASIVEIELFYAPVEMRRRMRVVVKGEGKGCGRCGGGGDLYVVRRESKLNAYCMYLEQHQACQELRDHGAQRPNIDLWAVRQTKYHLGRTVPGPFEGERKLVAVDEELRGVRCTHVRPQHAHVRGG